MKLQNLLLILFILSFAQSIPADKSTCKNLFAGPLFTYGKINYKNTPSVDGFTAGLITNAQALFPHKVTAQFWFRGIWNAGGFKNNSINARLQDFEVFLAPGYNLIQNAKMSLNLFAGFGYDRLLTAGFVPNFEEQLVPGKLAYNSILAIAGINNQWCLSKNWLGGIQFIVRPDLHPHVLIKDTEASALVGFFFRLKHSYGIRTSANITYQNICDKYAWSVSLFPYFDFDVHGRTTELTITTEQPIIHSLSRILAGSGVLFSIEW